MTTLQKRFPPRPASPIPAKRYNHNSGPYNWSRPLSASAGDSSEDYRKVDAWLLDLKKLYQERGKSEAYAKEKEPLREYITALIQELATNRCGLYELVRPFSVGGTGVIFIAKHKHLQDRDFVIKFTRPCLKPEDRAIVENECKVLPLFDHANIIRVIDVGSVNVGESNDRLSFVVEPLVVEAKPLGKWIDLGRQKKQYQGYVIDLARRLCPSKPDKPVNPASLHEVLEKLTKLLVQWVSALKYIHSMNYVHLDVKPENAIVDKDGHLLVIDLGSAQEHSDKKRPELTVYFSGAYADPDLWAYEEGPHSMDRVMGILTPRDLKPEFDYYALGQSILELLTEIANVHELEFRQLPLFRSLQFLATRLLNGRNEQKHAKKRNAQKHVENGNGRRYKAKETFRGLKAIDYETIRYWNLDDVLTDLKKEEGTWNPEVIVPELATYSKDSVRVVSGTNTVLSPRLQKLIRHPLFARLKMVSELGLISLVYPTADHSRYDHILGTYSYTASYIRALINDSQNPIFRNLISEHDIRAALLASLLHDFGQYPLAHDLEEVQPRIFEHGRLSIDMIEREGSVREDETIDEDGLSLVDIITRSDRPDCWGVKLDYLKRILEARRHRFDLSGKADVSDFKVEMLSALIDGPIDADKADYIRRDSEACRIPYGDGLDIERLLRVLTIAVYREDTEPESERSSVTVGVYQKGKASAESLSLLRYLLYASVYWHHASRILKSMLQYATALSMARSSLNDSGADADIQRIRRSLRDFISMLVPPFNRVHASRRESWMAKGWSAGLSYTDWLMLGWIGRLCRTKRRGQVRSLLNLIATRRPYKRIHTLQRRGKGSDLADDISDLRWPERIQMSEKLSESIKSELRKSYRKTTHAKLPKKILKVFDDNLAILVDVPLPARKMGFDRPLKYVPELKEKTYSEVEEEPIDAKALHDTVEGLMTSISPIRILCHPDLRILIRTYVTPQDFTKMIHKCLS